MHNPPSDLSARLCTFLMHEETPVESILAGHALEEVFDVLEAILRSGRPESVTCALGFVRDAHLYEHPLRDAFQWHLRASRIWESLRTLLVAPDRRLRSAAVYTVGKLCERDRAGLLLDAFPFYLQKDPIGLPTLLWELARLTGGWHWDLLERVAAAGHYLVRWSLCTILDDSGSDPETAQRFLGLLARLKADPHPLVAAEALWRYERVHVKLRPKLAKAEWRKEVRRIAALEPKVTFASATVTFAWDRSDYSLDAFDRFVTGMTSS